MGIILPSMYKGGPTLSLVALYGWANRSVSLMMESRTGVSDSHCSSGIAASRDESDAGVVDSSAKGLLTRRDSTSAAAFARQSGWLPRKIINHDAIVSVARAPAIRRPIINYWGNMNITRIRQVNDQSAYFNCGESFVSRVKRHL